MNAVWSIWRKEMVDTLRDRRTLLIMVLVPLVLMPGLFVGLAKLIEWQALEAEREKMEVLLVGGERARTLVDWLKEQPKVGITPVATAVEAGEKIRRKDAKVALVIEDPLDDGVKQEQPVRITVLHNQTDVASMIQTAKLKGMIDDLRDRVVTGRLERRRMDPTILAPFRLTPKNMASEEEMAGFVLGMIIPMVLIMWAMTGGMYSAIDLSAGEKERSTLEALLLSPASRTEITLGKFSAVFTVSYATMIAALLSLFLTFLFVPLTMGGAVGAAGGSPEAAAAPGIRFQMSLEGLSLMLLVSIFLAATFSALQLALGIFAKSFKEAQNLISPLYLAVVIPVVVVNSLPSFKPSTGHFLIPGLNAVLLFKELLMGTQTSAHVGVTFASMAVCSAVCLAATIAIFNREGVVLKG